MKMLLADAVYHMKQQFRRSADCGGGCFGFRCHQTAFYNPVKIRNAIDKIVITLLACWLARETEDTRHLLVAAPSASENKPMSNSQTQTRTLVHTHAHTSRRTRARTRASPARINVYVQIN